MVIEFKKSGEDYTKPQGIKFRRETEDGDVQEMLVPVIDKFPTMENIHVEGRRVVEVSVELFISLVALQGFTVVAPDEEEVTYPESREF